MFGLGNKIVTSYHHPNFKMGLMIAICDSKKELEERPLSEEDFREAYNGIIKEIYFDKPETLKRFIDQLNDSYDKWISNQSEEIENEV